MTTIKGVDRSVQSLPQPTVEVDGIKTENATVTFHQSLSATPPAGQDVCHYCQGKGKLTRKGPKTDNVAENVTIETRCKFCNGTGFYRIPMASTWGNVSIHSVEAYFSILLNAFLALTDTAIPNKDQNKAFKHLFRKAMDQQFRHLQNLAELEDGTKGYHGSTPADYLIEPHP